MNEFTPDTNVSRTWVPEAMGQRGKLLQPEAFYLHTRDKVKVFSYLFQGQLLKIFLTSGQPSPTQVEFIDQAVISTSRLIHRELLFYNLSFPNPTQITEMLRPLPENLKKIQGIVNDPELTEAIWRHYEPEKHHDISETTEGVALYDDQPWLDITTHLARGVVRSSKFPELTDLMQDCAGGLIKFIDILAEANGGLAVDDYTQRYFAQLIASYNDLLLENSTRR